MLTEDNRDMNEMERYYIARIEALERRIEELQKGDDDEMAA